jgi:homoserine O-succinyltransferase
MPDSAFEATERQFLDLLDSGSGPVPVEVDRYALAGVPRGERIAALIAEEYSDLDSLYDRPPDLLLVTGANPVERRIEDEPYWAELTELLRFGSEQVGSMLLSCLSAHAALTVFDGVEREFLTAKCTGVFAQDLEVDHPLARGMESSVVLPHSRWNTVPEGALRASGYELAMRSAEVGWSVATRRIENADVVLVQGHPEYEAMSLLREYRRDLRRYASGERDELPSLPLRCVAEGDWPSLEELHLRVTGGEREPALVETYPFNEVGARAPRSWSTVANRLYANWLAEVAVRSN